MPERRWIIVVRPDRAALYAALCQKFEPSQWVEVILDRRRGERRRQEVLPDAEARWWERRSGPGNRAQTPEYRLADRGDGFDVYEATELASGHCGECGVTVSFEMPGSPSLRCVLS